MHCGDRQPRCCQMSLPPRRGAPRIVRSYHQCLGRWHHFAVLRVSRFCSGLRSRLRTTTTHGPRAESCCKVALLFLGVCFPPFAVEVVCVCVCVCVCVSLVRCCCCSGVFPSWGCLEASHCSSALRRGRGSRVVKTTPRLIVWCHRRLFASCSVKLLYRHV